MTDKMLTSYYVKNKDRFQSLSRCSSVSELLLKLTIYGQQWNEWDWLLLLTEMVNDFDFAKNEPTTTALYDDMLDAIDNSILLDGILTKKNVILSIIYGLADSRSHVGTHFMQNKMSSLLAHVFKKFPDLWTMSWMVAKFKDKTTKQWTKYHRLGAYLPGISRQYSYTHPKECYYKFIATYIKSD